jgi:hypothetical protein
MKDKGIIIRPAVSREYVALPNAVLADRRMSIETRGMVAYMLSKSRNFEIRPWALARALSTEGKRLGRTKLDRMMREAMAAGYMARSEKQARKDDGSFGRFAYIVGMPGDVTAEVWGLSVAYLPHARKPHTGDPRTGGPHTDFGSALSTKVKSSPTRSSTKDQHHQSGHPSVASLASTPQTSDKEFTPMGQRAKALGLTFREASGNAMPPIDIAVIDGNERRGCWMASMYPPARGAA